MVGMPIDAEIQARQKQMWTAGDFPTIAQRIIPVSENVVKRAGVEPGMKLLDVATGTGNAAVIAATEGAEVTGVDITPKLLDVARERAAASGLEIKFLEGDAQELPAEDGSFDRVTSVFGAMFAPDQPLAASELVRVCRPGGRIVNAAWTPEGLVGRAFIAQAQYMPPPAPGFTPPILWGAEDPVRELFAPHDVALEFHRETVLWQAESVEAWVTEDENLLGPAVMAKAALEPEGKWEALRADVVEIYNEMNEAEDGSFSCHVEYLITVATRV
jgi:SAM-dependent methyltransferase